MNLSKLKPTFLFFLLCISAFIVVKAQSNFDPVLAKNLLAEGTATIKGRALSTGSMLNEKGKNKKMKVIGANISFYLYPYTAYHKKVLKAKQDFSVEANKYYLTTKTDSLGYFTFIKMKPGKYYIEGTHQWNGTQKQLYVESTTETLVVNGGGQVMGSMGSRKNYNMKYADVLFRRLISGIVEIKNDGEIVTIELDDVRY